MVNDPPKKRAAQQHHDPVAVDGIAQAGRGDVIVMVLAVAQPQPNGLEAVAKEQAKFAQASRSDVVDIF